MSEFNSETLNYLKRLARIEISSDEEEELTLHLKKIVAYVEQLGEIDTSNVKICTHVMDGMVKNVFREDEDIRTMSREDFLSNAPDQIGGMIRTPPVMREPE